MRMKNIGMWVTVGIAALIGAAALGLWIYGVSTHTEPTIQSVCWDGFGVAHDECAHRTEPAEALVWPQSQMPLVYEVSMYDGSDPSEARSTIDTAAALWNSQVGVELLRGAGANDEASVSVVWGAPIVDNGDLGAVTWFRRPMRARVEIYNTSNVRWSYLIAVHELGHVLGLAHDDYEASPMWPHTRDDSTDGRMDLTVVSGDDRSALRDLYQR